MSKTIGTGCQAGIQPLLYGASLLLLPLAVLLFFSSANQAVFQFLNDRLVHWQGDVFWAIFTNLGDGFFLFPLAMLLFWRSPQQQLAVILSILLLALTTHIIKMMLGMPRPGAELDASFISVVGPLLKGDSMPSGHAGTAFVLAGLGLIFLERNLKALLFILMTLVAVSRIAVGAHWPCDVICGAWMGLVCAAAGSWLSYRVKAGFKTRLAFIALGFVAMVVLPGYNNGFQHYPAICLMQYALAVLAALIVIAELLSLYREYLGSSTFKHSALWSRFQWVFNKLLRFAVVGASGFVVDMTVFTLLSSLFGVPHLFARGASYWCSASWNWFWNRTITFGGTGYARKLPQWIKYLAMCAISFVPNWGTYYLLTSHFSLFEAYKPLALMAGVAAGMGFNFTIAALIIFDKNESIPDSDDRSSHP